MNVCVVGLGYIGLPTSLMMAASGVDVIGVDYSKPIVDKLNNAQITFEEDGLEELFDQARERSIAFTCEYCEADMYVIAVPTPYDKQTKRVDARYVISAVKSVCGVAPKGAIIVIESTIAPGTIDAYVRPAIEGEGLTIGEDVHLAHAPERIIPGNMINELRNNNRTIGADDKRIAETVKSVYASFCKGTILLTDIRTAEMSKVVENTFRDVNIAFANELAKICDSAGLDVYEVIRIANSHPRVNILSPGPGVGGHCISVDPWFLVGDFPNLAKLTWEARRINDSMPEYVLDHVHTLMLEHGITDVSRIGFYGLTYKENVDDYRESPTLQLAQSAACHLAQGALRYYDPYIDKQIVDGQMFDLASFLDAIDIVVIMVAHDEILQNQNLLAGKIVYDTRNCLELENAVKL